MFIDTCESKSEEPRLFRQDVGLSRDKTRSFRFNRTSVLAPWKRETLSRNWSRWLTSGTAERSRSAALKPAGSSSCEETAPRKSLPAWRTAWWPWAPWWATGRKTSSLSGALRTVIANVAGEVDLKKKKCNTISYDLLNIDNACFNFSLWQSVYNTVFISLSSACGMHLRPSVGRNNAACNQPPGSRGTFQLCCWQASAHSR